MGIIILLEIKNTTKTMQTLQEETPVTNPIEEKENEMTPEQIAQKEA